MGYIQVDLYRIHPDKPPELAFSSIEQYHAKSIDDHDIAEGILYKRADDYIQKHRNKCLEIKGFLQPDKERIVGYLT